MSFLFFSFSVFLIFKNWSNILNELNTIEASHLPYFPTKKINKMQIIISFAFKFFLKIYLKLSSVTV